LNLSGDFVDSLGVERILQSSASIATTYRFEERTMDNMEPDVIEPSNAIALLGPTPLNPVAIFQPGGVDDLLTRIKARHYSTRRNSISRRAKGRAAIASLAPESRAFQDRARIDGQSAGRGIITGNGKP